jgi:YbbR domain-containing protein
VKVEKLQRHTLKVLSGLLAISLWFYVINSGPTEIDKKLPIEYILPKGTTLVSFSERQISLKLKGPKAFVSNVFSKKEKFVVDLNPYYHTAGKKFTVKFFPSNFELPFGVEIVEMGPKETNIEIDQVGLTQMPVKVQFFGDLPKDKKLKDFKITPDSVMIKGPLEILKTLSRVNTVPINLSLLSKDEGDIILQISPLDPRLNLEDDVKVKFHYKTKKN